MSENYQPDNLIAGDFPLVSQSITIAPNQNLKRGAILGRVQASGHYVVSVAASTDGSQNPIAILAEDIAVSSNPTTCVSYLSGQFNRNALTFGEGHTAETISHSLRLLNIYI